MNYPAELTETYEIYEQIGEGGGGSVYRALHKRLQKIVVLKKIKGSAGSIQDYRTEVDILKNLRHSYLPQVLDFIETADGVFTVMDYIPGKSIRELMDEGRRFSEKELLKYASQLCEALAYLHSQNPPIVHGDIKPDNIMITPEDNVCLIDFNISGMFEGKGVKTLGYTPGFSAPEQVQAFEEAKRCFLEQAASQNRRTETMLLSNGAEKTETMLLQESAAETKTMLLPENAMAAKTMLLSEDSGEISQDEYSVTVIESVLLQNKGQKEAKGCIDCRSDIYSLGATLYTMVTGKLLDSKKNNTLNGLSDGMTAILAKSVEYRPEKRFADAGKMLSALRQVHKRDKGYRRMVFRQNIMFVLLLTLLVCSGFAIVEGRQRMEAEQRERYEALIEQMETAVNTDMEEVVFEELYREAVTMEPTNIAAYAAKAYYLQEYQSNENVLAYLQKILEMPLTGDEAIKGNVYYLYAECYFQEGDYRNARWNYEKALQLRQDNAEVYRDYAISLVYLGEIEEARRVLASAEEFGMAQADVFMVQGELERMTGELQKALEYFSQVLEAAQDEYLRQRAYIMASRTFQEIGTVEALQEDVLWLQQGISELSRTYQPLIYEALVQDYITLCELTGETEYTRKAVSALEEIVENHWDTMTTYSNLIILTDKIGELEQAADWADKMRGSYPNSYVTYMRLAFLELSIQKQLENEARSYQTFAEYYNPAKAYAAEQLHGNVTDSELLMLDAAYQQVVDGGWLE